MCVRQLNKRKYIHKNMHKSHENILLHSRWNNHNYIIILKTKIDFFFLVYLIKASSSPLKLSNSCTFNYIYNCPFSSTTTQFQIKYINKMNSLCKHKYLKVFIFIAIKREKIKHLYQ